MARPMRRRLQGALGGWCESGAACLDPFAFWQYGWHGRLYMPPMYPLCAVTECVFAKVPINGIALMMQVK
jgi:hypothetical protein